MNKRTNNEHSKKMTLLNSTSPAVLECVFVGSVKGGTGKSTTIHGFIDHLLRKGRQVVLIDTDTGNPDCAACYLVEGPDGLVSSVPQLEVLTIEMRTREGFLEVLRKIDEMQRQNKTVIVNSKAGNDEELKEYADFVTALVERVGPQAIRTLWVINNHLDTLQALDAFLKAVPTMPVAVVMPKAWGDERKYGLYLGSDLKKRIDAAGGKSLAFPVVHPPQLKGLFQDRASLEEQYKQANFIEQVAINQLRKQVDAFCAALDEAAS
ncbi:nucleotide-binding protein [Rhodoblastus sp.]|uniref:nucleotide-binding protein n=1 Tax=Rhodoblastus sp. TaxID=1962975 RepID=UPI003F9B8AFE